jgi:hypothetical protein
MSNDNDQDGIESLGRMVRVQFPGLATQAEKAEKAEKAAQADDPDDGDSDALFVGDMTEAEFRALIKAAVARALEQAMAQANAKVAPAPKTKEAKRRITNSPRPGQTFKG